MARVKLDASGLARLDLIIDQTTQDVTDAVADDARLICPVRTGKLRDSIESERIDERTGRVVARRRYAAPVELGHRKVLWGRETNEYVPAQPYLRPALFRVRVTL